MELRGKVVAVCASPTHTISKPLQKNIKLLKGLGIEGDAHAGETVKHRSRVAQDPSQPNLRQVHLIHLELHDQLNNQGFDIYPGLMGENITTQGIDLLSLPRNTRLMIGDSAMIKVTGLRNPCHQLDGIASGLMKAVLDKDEGGNLIRKAGIMGIVEKAGMIQEGDTIVAELPPEPFINLERV